MKADWIRLSKKLQYEFQDWRLLDLALTHRSKEHRQHNERLEFLGDSLLNFIVGAELYRKYPYASEGQLTRLRSSLVKGETLASLAREFELGSCIVLGLGELKSGGRDRDSILANALEAVIAAIYLDAGIERCEMCVLAWYEKRLAEVSVDSTKKDPKTQLQEYLQARQLSIPTYLVIRTEGDVHEQMFFVECRVEALNMVARAEGSSRRRAEQAAARKILDSLPTAASLKKNT